MDFMLFITSVCPAKIIAKHVIVSVSALNALIILFLKKVIVFQIVNKVIMKWMDNAWSVQFYIAIHALCQDALSVIIHSQLSMELVLNVFLDIYLIAIHQAVNFVNILVWLALK